MKPNPSTPDSAAISVHPDEFKQRADAYDKQCAQRDKANARAHERQFSKIDGAQPGEKAGRG